MTDQIDNQLETFYGCISQQPLTARLDEMTMTWFKERAGRRLFTSLATGTLVAAVAIAGAVVGLAAHLDRVTPGSTAPHATNGQGTAAQATAQPTPSANSTRVTLTGPISGIMQVTSTVCWPGSPVASGYAQGQPVPGQSPAGIEAEGLLDGEHWFLTISQDADPNGPGAATGTDATTASLGKAKLGGYSFYGPIGSGVTTFKAEHMTIFDFSLTPDAGNSAPVTAVGQIVCP